MPDSSRILKMALVIGVLASGIFGTIAYSDSTSGRTLSICSSSCKYILNHADYIYLAIVIFLSPVSLCSLRGTAGKGYLTITVKTLMSFAIFLGFIISGAYAIAVAFELQCCFHIDLMDFQHFENTDDVYVPIDDGYTGDGLAECKNFDSHGTCNIEHYFTIGGPWLAVNVLNCLLSSQISYIEEYAREVESAHDEFLAYAERTNMVVEGSDDDDDRTDRIELAFQP
jgi:hypothetical protein